MIELHLIHSPARCKALLKLMMRHPLLAEAGGTGMLNSDSQRLISSLREKSAMNKLSWSMLDKLTPRKLVVEMVRQATLMILFLPLRVVGSVC